VSEARATLAGRRLTWTLRRARLLALSAAVALAGCASTTRAKTARHAAPARELRIGEGATVAGADPGEKIQVTLLAFMPNIPGGANDHPEFDMQYVGVELRLRNVGSVAYSGAPAEGVTVSTNEGQKSKRAVLSEGACSERFSRTLDIAPGQSEQGCVPVQIPVVATATQIRFAPSGGSTGVEWSLAKPRKATH
jgi:hypothetical protein